LAGHVVDPTAITVNPMTVIMLQKNPSPTNTGSVGRFPVGTVSFSNPLVCQRLVKESKDCSPKILLGSLRVGTQVNCSILKAIKRKPGTWAIIPAKVVGIFVLVYPLISFLVSKPLVQLG